MALAFLVYSVGLQGFSELLLLNQARTILIEYFNDHIYNSLA